MSSGNTIFVTVIEVRAIECLSQLDGIVERPVQTLDPNSDEVEVDSRALLLALRPMRLILYVLIGKEGVTSDALGHSPRDLPRLNLRVSLFCLLHQPHFVAPIHVVTAVVTLNVHVTRLCPRSTVDRHQSLP